MLERRFQDLKDSPRGLPGKRSVKLVFEVPGLQDYSNTEAMIENGLMKIPRYVDNYPALYWSDHG
jgi:hypothetical protein